MIEYTNYIDNKGMIGIIRRTCNYVDDRLVDHGFRVACMVSRLLEQMGSYDMATARDISVIAMFHDIGAYKTDEISRMLEFETSNVQNHSAYGNLFIKYFTSFDKTCPCSSFHHTPWCILKNMNEVSEENKIVAQLLNIADKGRYLYGKRKEELPGVCSAAESRRRKEILPVDSGDAMQDAFAKLCLVQEEGEESGNAFPLRRKKSEVSGYGHIHHRFPAAIP